MLNSKKGFALTVTSAIILILVVVGGFAIINWARDGVSGSGLNILSAEQGGGVTGDEDVIDAFAKLCPGVESTTYTPKFSDKHNLNTNGNDGYSISIWNPRTNTWDEDGTGLAPRSDQTLSPFDKVRILYNSNQTAVGTTFMPEIFEDEIPCKGTYKPSYKITDIGSSMITDTVTNADGQTLNNVDSGAQLIASGDEDSMEIEIKVPSEDQLGLVNQAVCVEWNNTGEFDDLVISGPGVTTMTKPSRLATASGFAEDCYIFPALNKDNRKITLLLDYDADDDDFEAADNLSITHLGDFAFRDSNTIQYEVGFETDQDTQSGAADETSTIYLTSN